LGGFIGAQRAGDAGAHWLPAELGEATAAGWRSFWLLPMYLMGGVLLLAAIFLPQDKKQQ
jgi:hypothetical protein